MMANAAFHIGLTIGLSHVVNSFLPAFPFRYADFNFYRAAQGSLESALLWPTLDKTSPREVRAGKLCRELLPIADEGLAEIGVDESERKSLLGLISDRLDANVTPAKWQRETVREMGDIPRDAALRGLVERYLEKSLDNRPVAEW